MTLQQNKQVALDAFRVLETGDPVVADRIIAPDFINGRRMTIPIDLIGGSEAPQA